MNLKILDALALYFRWFYYTVYMQSLSLILLENKSHFRHISYVLCVLVLWINPFCSVVLLIKQLFGFASCSKNDFILAFV